MYPLADKCLASARTPYRRTSATAARAIPHTGGMGLAKALRWVENHGGTIRLDSALGQGTTTVLILPVNAAAPAPQSAPTLVPANP